MILISLRSVLNQKGWRNSEIEARIQRIEAGEDLGEEEGLYATYAMLHTCLLYTSPSPRDATLSRMPSSA